MTDKNPTKPENMTIWEKFRLDTEMGIQASKDVIKNSEEILEFQNFILDCLNKKIKEDDK